MDGKSSAGRRAMNEGSCREQYKQCRPPSIEQKSWSIESERNTLSLDSQTVPQQTDNPDYLAPDLNYHQSGRSSTAFVKDTLNIPCEMHRVSVHSCRDYPSTSYLGLPPLRDQHPGGLAYSSEYLQLSQEPVVETARFPDDFQDHVARLTAKAVVAASERQSRTALTEIPLSLYRFSSEYALSQPDYMPPNKSALEPERAVDRYSRIKRTSRLEKASSINKTKKPKVKNFHSLDETIPLKVPGCSTSETNFVEGYTDRQRVSGGVVRAKSVTRAPKQTSLWNVTRNVSQRLNTPFQRVAASLHLKRSTGQFARPKLKYPMHASSVDVNNMLNDNQPNGPKFANKILQSDQDFAHEMDKSADSTDGTNEKNPDAANGEDGKPTTSYLKEQFFSFFQPAGNKLAMKLFGTKMALDREKMRLERQGKWIVHPCSNFRFYWDVIMLVMLIANLIVLPVAISFFNDEMSLHWIAFNCISDTVFLIDITVNFRTGIIKNNFADEIVLNPREIARHYIRTWFFLDLISSIPLDYIYLILHDNKNVSQLVHAGRALRFLRFVKLLSLIRLLRLSRLVRYVSQWEEFLTLANKFIRIFNLVLLLLLLGHWNACMQFLIPMLNDFPVDSWVSKGKLQHAHWFDQYTWALFKAMSHMLSIGYGRFPPTSLSEAWVILGSMISGGTGYALFIGHAAALIQSFDCSKRLYREKFKQVDEYMAFRKLPRALRQRIANYYEHRYQGKMFNETDILGELSECLREQIINYNCRALVAAVPFFTFADQNFVSEVVVKLRYEVFQPGDLIVKEGTIGSKMYFIQEGIVDIVTRDGKIATSLSDGSYFGEIGLLANTRRVASVRAETYCNVYSLDRASFLEVLDNYPLMRRTMESVAAERMHQIGRDPLVVIKRKDLCDDLKLVNEIVNQTIAENSDTDGETSDNLPKQHENMKTQFLRRLSKFQNKNLGFHKRRSTLLSSQEIKERSALMTRFRNRFHHFHTKRLREITNNDLSEHAHATEGTNDLAQVMSSNQPKPPPTPPELIITVSRDESDTEDPKLPDQTTTHAETEDFKSTKENDKRSTDNTTNRTFLNSDEGQIDKPTGEHCIGLAISQLNNQFKSSSVNDDIFWPDKIEQPKPHAHSFPVSLTKEETFDSDSTSHAQSITSVFVVDDSDVPHR